MTNTSQFVSSKGIRLEVLTPGDIVTVKVKPRPQHETTTPSPLALLVGDTKDEADSPQHYRMNNLWRVLAVNAGQVVIECVHGYAKGRREIWSISHHKWFEASELLEALEQGDNQ